MRLKSLAASLCAVGVLLGFDAGASAKPLAGL
jgi:hypothetical protein